MIIDDFRRECLCLDAGTSMSGGRVVRELTVLVTRYGEPLMIVSDNGTEFTSHAILKRIETTRLEWHDIASGKPQQNTYLESFSRRSRDECLDEALFAYLAQTREVLAAWEQDYNTVRPHSPLDGKAPDRSPDNGPGRESPGPLQSNYHHTIKQGNLLLSGYKGGGTSRVLQDNARQIDQMFKTARQVAELRATSSISGRRTAVIHQADRVRREARRAEVTIRNTEHNGMVYHVFTVKLFAQ